MSATGSSDSYSKVNTSPNSKKREESSEPSDSKENNAAASNFSTRIQSSTYNLTLPLAE